MASEKGKNKSWDLARVLSQSAQSLDQSPQHHYTRLRAGVAVAGVLDHSAQSLDQLPAPCMCL